MVKVYGCECVCVCVFTMSGPAEVLPVRVCPCDIWPGPFWSPVQSPAGEREREEESIRMTGAALIFRGV